MTPAKLAKLLPFPPDPESSPPMRELCWLYEFVRRVRPAMILEGGAGSTTIAMKVAMPRAKILAIDWAPPDSEWEKQLQTICYEHHLPVCPTYPPPLIYLDDFPLADLFFLDSSAGYFHDGGFGHHMRLQCLFLGLALCRKNAVVILHDAKRNAQQMQAVLRGISTPMDAYGQMEAVGLNLDWDGATGHRDEIKRKKR